MINIKNTIYWKISGLFLIVLLVVAGINLLISIQSAENHALLVQQDLNKELAEHTSHMIQPFFDSENEEEGLKDVMHSMMVINPSVEVYLLDLKGKILNYVAPDKVVKLTEVKLEPVKEFIHSFSDETILGDDPRNPGECKIFSAAKFENKGNHVGYIYIVLASQEYALSQGSFFDDYIFGLSARSILLTTIAAALVSLLFLWLLTKDLRKIMGGIKSFETGDLTARIEPMSGELGGVSATFNAMAETIETQIKQLEGVEKLRKELIANVSHDLRTPIASIQGFSEMLSLKRDQLSKEEETEYLEIINKNVSKLKGLVNDLFELSKLESEAIALVKEPMSITDLIQDIIGKYRLIAKQKGININAIYSQNVPMVNADIGLIDRVLQNLVDNSIKFCENGDQINIEVENLESGDINLKITDSGQGIKEEDLPHIFERYYKGKEKKGTGLGLAIARKIIELHGATIEVSSQLNVGTSFRFNLPIYR